MMILSNYINDLLYRYECVIVPEFGGFVTNRIGAKFNEDTNSFFPPSKQIAFNYHLKVNDGLLVNYVASAENISFDDASNQIAKTVLKWKSELKSNPLEINKIGTLILNENNHIVFEPTKKVNYLISSFGLSEVTPASIKKEEKKIIPIRTSPKKEASKGIPTYIKYAATAAILLCMSFVGNDLYQNNKQKNIIANQEVALEKKIQTATFIISNPLPTINLSVNKEEEEVKEKVISKKTYHVIAGAFQFKENAEKKVKQLHKLGYKSSIVGVNKWGLTQVAFESFTNRNNALDNLYRIKKDISRDAWLLVKK